MTAPSWIESVVVEFGRAAGLEGLRLGTRGAAALRFENGVALRIEYTGAELVVSMTAPAGDVRRLLSLSHPRARFARGFCRRQARPCWPFGWRNVTSRLSGSTRRLSSCGGSPERLEAGHGRKCVENDGSVAV